MRNHYTEKKRRFAEELFYYLYLSSDEIPISDVIIGFGHFDLRIPSHCGYLYKRHRGKRLIFTGGTGSGTVDLGRPEAVAFFGELKRLYPAIPDRAVILETESTNTLENVQFTTQKLASFFPSFRFGKEIKSAILVCNPYRQRRVFLTCRKNLPKMAFYNAPPKTSFDQEFSLFMRKGLDYIKLLVGEIDRIIRYGCKGDILPERIPADIFKGYRFLKHQTD